MPCAPHPPPHIFWVLPRARCSRQRARAPSHFARAEKAQQEVEVLRGLDHPGIVRYHEHFVHEDQLCVVMLYCEGGDLSNRIKERAHGGSTHHAPRQTALPS